MSAYSRATIAEIKKEARRMFPNMTAPITHILPRCYCVAKTAPGHAIFAVPNLDLGPWAHGTGFTPSGYRSEKTRELEAGDWASLAYVLECGHSSMEVILVHKRDQPGVTFSGIPAGAIVEQKQKRRKK